MRRFTRLLPALLLLIHSMTQYAAAWRTSFVNEDWSFVDLARGRSLAALLTDAKLYAGPWLRPWSQGVHYWALQGLFGTRVEGWHVVSTLLGAMSLVLYFEFVRRSAGLAEAGVASACVAALTAWGVPMTWIAGVQDLWMLAFAWPPFICGHGDGEGGRASHSASDSSARRPHWSCPRCSSRTTSSCEAGRCRRRWRAAGCSGACWASGPASTRRSAGICGIPALRPWTRPPA
jgi:hypothetical protein